MEKHKNWLAVILFGIVLSLSGTAMVISGKINFNNFYDVGHVEDVYIEEQNIQLDGEEEEILFQAKENEKKRNWLYMKVSELPLEGTVVRIRFMKHGENVYLIEIHLQNGSNWISMETGNYEYFGMSVPDGGVKNFYLEKMQLRENQLEISTVRAVISFGLFMGIYLVLYELIGRKVIYKLNQKITYSPQEFLQRIFLQVGDIGEFFYSRIGEKNRHRCRVGLLCVVFFYMQLISRYSLYTKVQYVKYHMYFCAVVMILYAFLCWEHSTKMLDWNTQLAKYWFLLWGIAAISEFIVPKRFLFQGIMMIFIMGFVYFMVGNMRNPMDLVNEIGTALKIWFWCNVPLCILLSPYAVERRYCGISKNPNIWAMDMVFVMAVFLSSILKAWGGKRKKIFVLFDICAVGIVWDMTVKTGSTCGFVPCIFVIVFFVLEQFKHLVRRKNKTKTVIALTGGIFVFILSMYVSDWTLHSNILNKEVIVGEIDMEEKIQFTSPFRYNVQAASVEKIQENRVIKKLFKSRSISSFLTGRDYFWKKYLRATNLWGHYFAPDLWGKAHVAAHNGYIAILYRYGILAVVPYIMMLVTYCRELWRRRTNEPEYILVFMFALENLLLLFIENVEFPFYYISWYCLYLPMGVFLKKKLEN